MTDHADILVGVDRAHLPVVRGWLRDRDLRDRVGMLHHPDELEHERWYEQIVSDPTRLTRMILDADGQAVGLCGLRSIDLVYRRAEAFIYLGEGTTRAGGLGRAAMTSLLATSFETLGLHRIEARVFAFNRPAADFFRAVGFTEEGAERDGVFKQGAFHDVLRFGMLITEHRTAT